MNFKDALRALADGKGVRCIDMPIGSYLYIANNGILSDEGVRVDIGRAVYVNSSWEIYTPPAVKKTVTLWRRPLVQTTDRSPHYFQPCFYDSKESFNSVFPNFKFLGDWESVTVEVEE